MNWIKKIILKRIVQNNGFMKEIISNALENESTSAWIMEKLGEKEFDFNNNIAVKQIADKYFEKISYSQTGEDILVDFIFKALKIEKPSYIDIGAFDPRCLSNTALLYLKGSRGINIEPNPDLIEKFLKERSEDININVGIYSSEGMLDYFVMDTPTLNTFSKEDAENYSKNHGHAIIETRKIKVETLEKILSKYNKGVFPDFMSLDAEGIDEIILNSIDFENNFPKVICVETITYDRKLGGKKNTGIINLIENKGYTIFADTNINTIFIKNELLGQFKSN